MPILADNSTASQCSQTWMSYLRRVYGKEEPRAAVSLLLRAWGKAMKLCFLSHMVEFRSCVLAKAFGSLYVQIVAQLFGILVGL